MPTSKSPKKDNKPSKETTEAKAIVSSLVVNYSPEPSEPVEKVTANGNTITMN